MSEEVPFKDVWDAAATDVTGLVAELDRAVEQHGGDTMLAAMSLAMSLDQFAPGGRCWLASRLAVALHMMNAATGPLADKLARDIVAELNRTP